MNIGVQRQGSPIHLRWRAVVGRFVLIFVMALAVGAGAIAFIDYQRFAASRSAQIVAELDLVQAAEQILNGDLQQAVSRVRVLRSWSSIRSFAADPTPARRTVIEREFLTLARSAAIYDQLRVLDLSGRELARVVDNGGRPIAVAPAYLRDLSDLPYVQQLLQLELGETDISIASAGNGPANDWGLRAASLLLDQDDRPTGILVLDYQGSVQLQRFRAALGGSWGRPMLLSSQGAWLADAGNQHASFAARFPTAWAYIRSHEGGRFTTDDGHFTFGTLSLQQSSAVGDRLQWKLLTWVPPAQFRYSLLRDLPESWTIYALLFLIAAPVSLLIAGQRTINVDQRRALAASEERLTLAFTGANDAMWDWDILHGRVYFSHRFKDMLGYGAEQIADRGEFWFRHTHPDDQPQVQAALAAHLEGRTRHYSMRYRLRHRDGHYIWVQARGQVQRDLAGVPVRMVGVMTDISEQVSVEDKLRQAAAVFENTSEAIVMVEPDGRIQAVNAAFTHITGYTAEEAVGRNVRLLDADQEQPDVFQRIGEAVRAAGFWRGEARLRRKNGELFPVWQNITGVRDHQGTICYYVAVLTDISTIKEAEERLAYLAHHDALTGLPNRLRLIAVLDQALRRAERHGQCVAVLFLDLDRFKAINDTFGHAAGDTLLQTVAQRLRACVRDEDTVARLAGDEFVVVLEEIGGPGDAREPAEKIIRAMREPVDLEDRQIVTSSSIGISIYPRDGRDGEALIKAADTAMYQAKQEGRNNYRYYGSMRWHAVREEKGRKAGLRDASPRSH